MGNAPDIYLHSPTGPPYGAAATMIDPHSPTGPPYGAAAIMIDPHPPTGPHMEQLLS